ncbi:MAG: outer membrane protein transport protein [Deltaproteobacteria bacterium]|nr:outer membrane protein transport protein [Deltaproteobacteria bacterium]
MSSRVLPLMTLGAALCAAASVGDRAVAGGFGIPEIGVRRTGMASVIGRPDDLSAIYHNPAGLALQGGWNLYLSMGVSLVDTEFRLLPWDQSDRFLGATAEADGYYASVRPSRAMGVIPMIAASAEVIPSRLVLGGAVYVGNATGAAFDEDAVTRYHLIDGYVVAPQAVLAASYRVADSLALGASVGVLNMRVHGKREVFPVINGMDVSMLTGSSPELILDGSGWAPTWMLAAFGRPHPRVSWGATVTGRVDAKLTGPVEITYSEDAPQPDVLVGTQTTEQLLPWAFMGGANFDLTPHIEIGSEVRYWLYRQYKKQHTDVTGIFLVRELETMKNYRDSWQVSGGVRVHDLPAAPGLELMLGTHFDRTPAPPQTVTLDQPTFSHVGLHSGLRYRTGRYRFGASYIHYWYDIPTIENSITAPPSNIRGSGANNIFTASVEARL